MQNSDGQTQAAPHGLEQVADTWERLAQIDPLWAVLSEPDKRGKRWVVADFLATGRIEIDSIVEELRDAHLSRFDAALDFGCGVGRLSIPLARHFSRVVGIDISPTMVETATRLKGDADQVTFRVNDRPDLAIFEDAQFDFIYSNIVLQHMDPALAVGYITEFYRVVRPGGFVVFQIPSHLTEEWLPGGSDGQVLAEPLRRAALEVIEAPPELPVASTWTCSVRIRNVSGGAWTQDLTNQINLGNHWRSEDGTMVIADDGRARLPGRLGPGEECNLEVEVRSPPTPGTFILEFDVVQEGISWFSSSGSSTATVIAHVVDTPVDPADNSADGTEGPLAAEPAVPTAYPTFMMRGVRTEEVEQLVERLGGEVLGRREHVTEWVSYRYFTRRRA